MDGLEPHISARALERAYRAHFDGLLTEVMPVRELARLFHVGRNKMATILERMEGVECYGRGLYRVPLAKMPPEYHLEKGLLPPGDGRCA